MAAVGRHALLRDAISAANDNFVEDTIELEAGETYSLSHDDPGAEGANAEGDLDVSGTTVTSRSPATAPRLRGRCSTATERVSSARRHQLAPVRKSAHLTITGGASHRPLTWPGRRYSGGGQGPAGARLDYGQHDGGFSELAGRGPLVRLRRRRAQGFARQRQHVVLRLGGGIVVTNSELTLANTTVTGNNANAPGGGVYM